MPFLGVILILMVVFVFKIEKEPKHLVTLKENSIIIQISFSLRYQKDYLMTSAEFLDFFLWITILLQENKNSKIGMMNKEL